MKKDKQLKENNMPYIVAKIPGTDKWGKYKKKPDGTKGKLVSRHDSKEKAKGSVAAYYANKK